MLPPGSLDSLADWLSWIVCRLFYSKNWENQRSGVTFSKLPSLFNGRAVVSFRSCGCGRTETLLPIFQRTKKYKLTKALKFTFMCILSTSPFANLEYLFDLQLCYLSQPSWLHPSQALIHNSLWTSQALSQAEPGLPSSPSLDIPSAVCFFSLPTCHLKSQALQLN